MFGTGRKLRGKLKSEGDENESEHKGNIWNSRLRCGRRKMAEPDGIAVGWLVEVKEVRHEIMVAGCGFWCSALHR